MTPWCHYAEVMPRLTPAQRATVVNRYLAGEGCPEIGASLGCSGAAIRGFLNRRGVPRRTQHEAQTRLPLNHAAFDVLTPEAAYWCGFIAADGTIVQRSDGAPEVAIVLARNDEGHLEKFRNFLGSGHAITHVKTCKSSYVGSTGGVRFSIRSQRIAGRLTELGVKHGPLAPELAVSRDFWRGAVDGDGYIGVADGRAQFKLVGRESLLLNFEGMARLAGCRMTVRPHKSIYVVGTSGAGAERIVGYLYEGATIGLDRKVNAARNIRDTEPARGRRVAARGDRAKSARSMKREPQRTPPLMVA